jgi:hypothetical protein
MLRRHAADWDKREMPVQAECCRQAARHMEGNERDLLAEIAELRKDAERYRWLRTQHTYDGRGEGGNAGCWFVMAGREAVPCDPGSLDDCIDEAMKAGVNSASA